MSSEHSVTHLSGTDPLTGYQQLIKRANHPILTAILERIIKQERTHYAFYRSQAEILLAESQSARRFVRWLMKNRGQAVGEGVKKPEEVDQLAIFLFSGADGREAVCRIDSSIQRLPGLAGIDVMEKVLDRAEKRFGVPSTASLPNPSL